MLDLFISAINTVLGWIRSGLSSIADFFWSISTVVGDIPLVGSNLEKFFSWIASGFDGVAYDVRNFGYSITTTLERIAYWLEQVADIASDVYGWISEDLLSAYQWAQNAIEAVADMMDDVDDLWYQIFTRIPGKFDSVWDRIAELFDELFGSIPDKLSALWDQINTIITELFTSIPEKFSSLWDQVNSFITEIFTSIPEKFSSLWDQVNTIITELFTSIPDKFSSLWDQIIAFPELIKGEVLQVLGPSFNLVSFFFEDIADFFSDPAEYFARKIETGQQSFVDRVWDVIEKILERVW